MHRLDSTSRGTGKTLAHVLEWYRAMSTAQAGMTFLLVTPTGQRLFKLVEFVPPKGSTNG